MNRRLSPTGMAFTLGVLALVACDETIPTDPSPSVSPSAVALEGYSVRELGMFGELLTTATAINAADQVVGFESGSDDVRRGFLWKDGVRTSLRGLSGSQSEPFDINDLGQVVGTSLTVLGKMRAFLWQNGVVRNLGSLGGRDSRAFGINNKGQIVGESHLTGNPRDSRGNRIVHAFLLSNGVMTDLGTLGGSSSAALDINDAGQVVGWSETTNGTRHPFLWQNGTMRDLLPAGSASTGTANAINQLGVVVGESNNHAFRYSGGVMRFPLGTASISVATDIRGGRIVGWGGSGGGSFVLAGGQVTRLPALPDTDGGTANAVNGAGVIVGHSINDLDGYHLVTMWTPE